MDFTKYVGRIYMESFTLYLVYSVKDGWIRLYDIKRGQTLKLLPEYSEDLFRNANWLC